MPSPANTEREFAVPRIQRTIEPADPLSGHHFVMPCRAVDSTGIKAEGEGEWNARKHGGSKRRIR